ncbi:MAG: hypothetical protein DSY82_02235 [Flavobacteriia bacterium]|nr:MAG: hypothetical protein DSY82_02235 [Flavobacteriia bacterium]
MERIENKEDYKKYDDYLRAKKHVKEVKGFYIHLAVYLLVNAYIFFNSMRHMHFEDIGFWMFSPGFFWGIGLIFHAYGVFGKNLLFSKEWEERKIREFMEKDNKDLWK